MMEVRFDFCSSVEISIIPRYVEGKSERPNYNNWCCIAPFFWWMWHTCHFCHLSTWSDDRFWFTFIQLWTWMKLIWTLIILSLWVLRAVGSVRLYHSSIPVFCWIRFIFWMKKNNTLKSIQNKYLMISCDDIISVRIRNCYKIFKHMIVWLVLIINSLIDSCISVKCPLITLNVEGKSERQKLQ